MSGPKSQVNIIAVVDVIGALSIKSLLEGNLCMVDDGAFNSTHQGTPNLITVVKPGQVVSWTALAVDLQTPVEIKNISFTPGNGQLGAGAPGAASYGSPGQGAASYGSPQGALGGSPQGALGGSPQGTLGGSPQGAPYGTQQSAYGTPGAQSQGQGGSSPQGAAHGDPASAKLDLDVWTGVVPHWMARGVPYQYRLEVQMYDGSNSIMHIDSPALMCQ
ncbi:hypothetical protein [Streptomyces luteocolor]|uniref:hypothetical protein n=1 Tax=Streptomyces luteocolor TaxID=285500 RepID=UPI000A8338C9|nr:hypothetical protein [Streptomyces luteocolor]